MVNLSKFALPEYLERVVQELKKCRIIDLSCAFILLAFVVRVWGIWNVSASDEYNEVLEALRVCSGHLNFDGWVKRFYLYVLAMEYVIYYSIGWVFNAFTSPIDFAEKIVRNMESLFILGRLTSAVAGAWTVGLLFKIGDRFFDRRVAVVASLLLTFTVFHIDLSQQAKVDAVLGILVVATLYFIFRLASSGESKKWDCAWGGLVMALAIQTKVNGVILIVPFIITVLFQYKKIKKRLAHLFGFFIPFFILGFVLGNPPVLFAPLKYIKSVLGLGAVYTKPVNVVPNDLIGFLAYPLYYYRNMGAVISLVTILAIVYSVFRLNKQRMVLLCFILTFYILMGSSKNLVASYYMIPVAPALFLLIGDFVNVMWKKTSGSVQASVKAASPWVITAILGVGLFYPMVKTLNHEISLIGRNTRYIAKYWIEANIPPGSKILMDSGKSINSFAPPIAENRESLERMLRTAKANIAEGRIINQIVDQNALVYYEMLVKTVPDISYDITSTMFGLDVKSVGYYVSNGYQYLIISRNMKRNRTDLFFLEKHPEIANFYISLDFDRRIKLIKVIYPTRTNRGNTFYIYKVIAHS